MADLSRARNRILTSIIALGVIDAAALIYLALPYRSGAAQPAVVQRRAEEEYRQLKPKAVPLQGIDQKLAQAQKDDAAFIQNRLSSRYSDVVEELGKLARANHISITSVAYKATPGKLDGLEALEMHAGLAGQYVDLVKFINSVERDKMFFIIDTVNLTGQKAAEVRLDVKLDTYLRSGASI
jgi:type IV pilus assembly protein PilO